MADGLHVAPRFWLPRETVVGRQAILATSGAGKSNTAVVLAEAMYDGGFPWVAVDPKGDWWGVRAGADGKAGGLEVPIFGGLHGDVPLEPTNGKLIANLIVDRRLTCVLDVSEFDTSQGRYGFLADFAETLLKRNTEPLHVFAEEADEYLPQNAREKGNLPRCLGAWQKLVKRGRFRGIGSTLITQRSAAINKDVLNMIETLIVMRTTAPLDRKEIAKWVATHGGQAELLDSLPLLEDGEAWVWSPQKLKIIERVQFNRRRTYDSGATPLMDAKASKAATLADIDLGALRSEMAETIAKAEADDPTKLRARIRELEKQVLSAVNAPVPEPKVLTFETQVEVVPPAVIDGMRAALAKFDETLGSLESARRVVHDTLTSAAERVRDEARSRPAPPAPATLPPARPRPSVQHAAVVAPAGEVGKGPTLILAVLKQHGGTMEKARLRLLTGQARSTSDRYLLTLKQEGLVTTGDPVSLTAAGTAAAPDVEMMPPPGDRLFEWWLEHPKVGRGPGAILTAVRAAGGQVTKSDCRASVGMATSTFDRYLLTIRQLGIVTTIGQTIIMQEDLL